MSLRQVLEEQIDRNEKNIKAYQKKVDKLPKGSLHEKKIGKNIYFYLKFRDENGKRVDLYVRREDVKQMRKNIEKRRQYLGIIKSLREDIQIAKKGLKK